MKKILNRLTIMFSMLVFLACTDDSLDPFRFNELQKGILLALRGDAFDNLNDNGCSNSFYYNNVLTTDAFSFDAEFLSEDQDLLQEVRVFALTIPTTPGKTAFPRTEVKVIPGSNFTIPSGAAHKQGNITVTFAEIKSALGMSDTDVEDLDKTALTIESDIILTDGRTIASSQIVNSGLYESAIFYPAQKLTYCAFDVNDFKPAATVKLRKGKPLKAGAKDTLDIKFDSDIITPPAVTLSPDLGTLGTLTKGADDKTFYAIYTAPAGYTGAITATVADATSDDSGVLLTMNDTDGTINVDDEKPELVSQSSGTRIGRNQFVTISASFNETIAKAPLLTVTGQGVDDLTDQKMDIDGKTVSWVYVWKDADNPTNTTHGDLSITIADGQDAAGNVHDDVNMTLVNDVAVPPAPSVTLNVTKHDYGTQILWLVEQTSAAVPEGSTTGTVYFVVLPDGDPAPTQKTRQFLGITVNDGFYQNWDEDQTYGVGDRVRQGDDIWESKVASNTGNAPEAGDNWKKLSLTFGSTGISADPGDYKFADFTPNGDLDVYFYFVSSTGNVSPNSGVLNVTMN